MQVRRGRIDDLPQLASGELGWAIDTRQLFMGNGSPDEGAPIVGNTEILTEYSSIVRNPITNTLTIEVTQPGHTFVDGTPVYFAGIEWAAAQADNEATFAIGIINNVEGPQFNVILYGTTNLSGFVPGTYYYTSDTVPGTLVDVAPDKTNLVLFALSNSQVVVAPDFGVSISGQAYVRPDPMEISVGGATIGTTFTGSVQDALDKILYPYIEPTFSAFTLVGQATILEVGSIVASGSRTFTWGVTSLSRITPNSLSIEDLTTPGVSFPTVSAQAITPTTLNVGFVNQVQKTTNDTHTWRITADGTQSGDFTRDFTVEWQWRFFYGSSTNAVLTEAQIEGLQSNALMASPIAIYDLPPGGYKYIAYPATFPASTIFRDTATGLEVSMTSLAQVSLTNANGVSINYRVYRTTNQLGGDVDIQIVG